MAARNVPPSRSLFLQSGCVLTNRHHELLGERGGVSGGRGSDAQGGAHTARLQPSTSVQAARGPGRSTLNAGSWRRRSWLCMCVIYGRKGRDK